MFGRFLLTENDNVGRDTVRDPGALLTGYVRLQGMQAIGGSGARAHNARSVSTRQDLAYAGRPAWFFPLM